VFVAFSPVRKVRELPGAPEPDPARWAAAPALTTPSADA